MSPKYRTSSMGNLLYVVAVVLLVIWAFGYIGMHSGGLIHLLLVLAIISIVYRLVKR